jgi:AbrB family looped-hinge helix DNA binding protein
MALLFTGKESEEPSMTSRISGKGQVTIPKKVREGIGLQLGDYVVYELHDGVVILRKAEPFDADYHRALTSTLSEWSSSADEKAFRDL